MEPPSVNELAKLIDHSIIDLFHTQTDLEEGPFRVKQARQLLADTDTKLQTFVCLPHGSDHTAVKVLQAELALQDGAQELDMVINISALLSGDIDYVEKDVKAVVETAKPYGVPVKAIVEVFFLNDEQLTAAALAAERAGVAFIKTSTGTKPDKTPDVEHSVRLLRSILKPETTIKASGGCYTIDAILTYYRAGARRFGASETTKILDDYAVMLREGTTGF
ncbi:deoxyribose-phosphate aldolase [Aspergillus ellipticus CBS 707.79]|uniref:Deoxyribose-phosphate aldolase n=1 Tax=Aspergillus ellipticus CBS 707.79 TaxID=1448320 RepID=A0A319D618_9EURO|nr:deoxyribose-phosphate aldolase [Aspergillus ellipticus CBS 707.79]